MMERNETRTIDVVHVLVCIYCASLIVEPSL